MVKTRNIENAIVPYFFFFCSVICVYFDDISYNFTLLFQKMQLNINNVRKNVRCQKLKIVIEEAVRSRKCVIETKVLE